LEKWHQLAQERPDSMPTADPRWQQLIREHLERLGIRSPEQQQQWLEKLQADPGRWQRFLEELRRHLNQHGQEVPPLPPIRPPVVTLGNSASTNSPHPVTAPTPALGDRQRSWDALRSWWERYIGPLDATPQVRDLLMQAIANGQWDLKFQDASGRNLWDILTDATRDSNGSSTPSHSDAASHAETDHLWRRLTWRWPRLDSWGFSRWLSYSPSSDFALPSGEGWPLLSYGLLSLAGAFLLVFWALRWSRQPSAAQNQAGPAGIAVVQGIDPRDIRTRQQLVQAFEYLSLRLLGPAVRSWTADAIVRMLARRSLPVSAEQFERLAKLYEQARYAPEIEILSPQMLEEGRGILCRIAGVSPA
jgi:hypothetical protein